MTKKSGRPPLKNKPLTQAERHQRWKENMELRKKDLATHGKGPKKRINLAIKESTLHRVETIANSLEISTTAAIELLLYRAAKQADVILEEIGEVPRSADMLARLRLHIRSGGDIDGLQGAINPQEDMD